MVAISNSEHVSCRFFLWQSPNASDSALYTSHQGAFNQVLMLDCCYEERLEVDAINQALRWSPYLHIRNVYNAERQGSGTGNKLRSCVAPLVSRRLHPIVRPGLPGAPLAPHAA